MHRFWCLQLFIHVSLQFLTSLKLGHCSKLNWPKRVSAVYWLFGTLFYPWTKAVIMMMKMTEADKLGLTSFLSGPGHSTRLTRTSMMVARAMMKKTTTMMMKKKIHSCRLLLSTHEWSSNDGDYEHYARPGAMITIMMIKQDNFLPKHWLKHYPFDGFLQILFDGGGGGG